MSRIIAGEFGGRRLNVPAGRSTRPTSDRVREAVFSRLEHLDAIAEVAVLDLYAGSGALGLEALSRGAAGVTLVDHDRRAVSACRRNVDELQVAARATIRQARASDALAGAARPHGLVFLDPPYELAETDLGSVLSALLDWLTPDAMVVVERSTRSPEPTWPSGLRRFDTRDYGETAVWFAEPCT